MIKLVVSTNRYEYLDFQCTQSLQNVAWENIECLIYHTSRDNDVDTILELSKAGEVVPKVIYINQQINSLYYGLFAGIDADIYNDESMLSDEETLNFLVEDYKNTGMTIKAPNLDMETISKFVAAVSKESVESLSKLVKNNLWLQTLESSLKSVETALVRTDEANVGMVGVFNKTSEIIETLQEGQTRTTEEIEKLSKYLSEVEQRSQGKNQNSMFFFSTFQVPNTVSKVLYIRVYSPCRYLLSFVGAYQHYLKMNKQLQSKILIAVPKLKQYIRKYDTFTRLATETINTRGIQTHEVFVTQEPKPLILNAFFNMNADLYIVIDMMFGESALLQGAKVVPLNAINGVSDIKTFGLKPDRCIITQVGLSSNIIIPHLQGYNNNPTGDNRTISNLTNKRTKYYESCHGKDSNGKDKAYTKLDKLLGI